MSIPAQNELELQASGLFEEQSAIVRHTTSPLVKAVLGTAPFTGGVASLLSDMAQRRQEIRLRRFLIALVNEVSSHKLALAQKVDKAFISSDEFAASVEGVLDEAARCADERKLAFLRQYLIATSLNQRPDISWREIFMQYLRQLSGAHLVVLSVFTEIQGELPHSDRISGIEIPGKVPLGIDSVVSKVSGVDESLARVVCVDLANLGLLVDWRMLSPSHKALQEKYSVSQNGVLFFRFLEGRWN